MSYSYVYGIQSGLFIKIGVASNIANRLRTMNLYNPHPCKIIARRQSVYAYYIEKRLHQTLSPYAIGREWFLIDPPLVRAAMTVVFRKVHEEMAAMLLANVRRGDEIEAKKAEQLKVHGVPKTPRRRRKLNVINA